MSKYFQKKYIKKARFINYWNQIDQILSLNPKSVLEIGVGNGIVGDILKKFNIDYFGMDINPDLKPDYVGSVEDEFLNDKGNFDLVLAAEILEHLPFDKFETCLKNIYNKTKKWVIISLPYRGFILALFFKFPFIKWIRLMIKFPYFWKKKTRTPEHYWEIGLKRYPLKRIKRIIKKSGFHVEKSFYSKDDPDRYLFVLNKN